MNNSPCLIRFANISRYVVLRREIFNFLLDQGLDINAGGNRILQGADKAYRNNTVEVLNRAAALGDIELFDYLVTRGARPKRSNALHNATRSKDAVSMITHLVNTYHLDVNAEDSCGGLNELVEWESTPGSPLNYAVKASNVPAVETLLNFGARIEDALGVAVGNEEIEIVRILLDAGADPSEGLGYAVVKDYFEGARLCLEHGGDVTKGEERDRLVAGLGGMYTGMSSGMRKLLDEWKV